LSAAALSAAVLSAAALSAAALSAASSVEIIGELNTEPMISTSSVPAGNLMLKVLLVW